MASDLPQGCGAGAAAVAVDVGPGLVSSDTSAFRPLAVLIQDPRSALQIPPRVSVPFLSETARDHECPEAEAPQKTQLIALELEQLLSTQVGQLLELLFVADLPGLGQAVEERLHLGGIPIAQPGEELVSGGLP